MGKTACLVNVKLPSPEETLTIRRFDAVLFLSSGMNASVTKAVPMTFVPNTAVQVSLRVVEVGWREMPALLTRMSSLPWVFSTYWTAAWMLASESMSIWSGSTREASALGFSERIFLMADSAFSVDRAPRRMWNVPWDRSCLTVSYPRPALAPVMRKIWGEVIVGEECKSKASTEIQC